MRIRERLLVLLVGLVMVASAWPARAGAAEPYEGKTLTIMVGFPAGGGYDRMARLVARHLPKHIPGQPTVIVQNMTGGASVVLANQLYNVARPDGLTIGTFARNLSIAQLLRVEGVRFDLTRFAWVASMASEPTVLTVRGDLPFRTVEDLRKAREPVIFAASGPGDTSHDYPLLLKAYLGLNLKLVAGYKGGPPAILAVERNEAHGFASSFTGLKPHIDRGLLRPLIRARAVAPGIEKLPFDEELATTALARKVLAMRSSTEVAGRPFAAPPGTPADRLAILQSAFEKVAKDPEAIAEAAKGQMDFDFLAGLAVLRHVTDTLQAPPDVVEEFKKYMSFGR